jgi:hypothetical protein
VAIKKGKMYFKKNLASLNFNYQEPGTTLFLFLFFLKVVVPNATPKFFKNFLDPKIRYLDRYKYPKKLFFNLIFSLIFRGLCTGSKCEKVVLYGFN